MPKFRITPESKAETVRVNLDLLPATLVGPGIVALVVGTVSAFVGCL
jgi:hypothetical protein